MGQPGVAADRRRDAGAHRGAALASAWSAIAEHLLLPGARGCRTSGPSALRVRKEILGPAHGFAGVVAALARRPELLPPAGSSPDRGGSVGHRDPRGRARELAARYGRPLADRRPIRTQWCHGAPGIVASLAALPRDDGLDPLLLAGGELTWAAGPLRKGANLCHGTAGNGFALLKLFTRTGDERWLERRGRFAMHAAAQVEAARRQYGRGRYSLWTGDLGTAIYLQQCLAGTSEVPAIDLW